MKVRLRPTREGDLDFVLGAEHSAENRSYVVPWSREQHVSAVAYEDLAHLIIETVADGSRADHIILAGLKDTNRSIEFRRIVVMDKNRGYGSDALRLTKRLAFEEWGSHRLWLDVKEQNVRARRVYESEGFTVEGVLRECLNTETGFESLVVMSMLRDEYDNPARCCSPCGKPQ